MVRHHMTVNGPVPFTSEEEAEWDAMEAEYAASEGARKAKEIRSQRNELLADTDWIVIMHTEKGTNIPMEWEVYRQALRDITDQAGFPFEVVWPEKPE